MKRLLLALFVAMSAVAADPELPVIESHDLDKLREHAGKDVTVVGPVTTIGTTESKSITFINVGMPKKQGFVAIVFQRNYGEFPDGFDAYRDKNVRVTGTLDLYQGQTPQIEVRNPSQITIVEE